MGSHAAPDTQTPGAVHRVHIPLRIADFVGKHVNNVRFQEFSQDARLMWFRDKFGVPGSRVPISLARWMEIDFRRVIGYGATSVWEDLDRVGFHGPGTVRGRRHRVGGDGTGRDHDTRDQSRGARGAAR